MVQKYLAGLGRDSVYRQIRAAACTVPPQQQDDRVMQDAIDMAMMEFGECWGLAARLEDVCVRCCCPCGPPCCYCSDGSGGDAGGDW